MDQLRKQMASVRPGDSRDSGKTIKDLIEKSHNLPSSSSDLGHIELSLNEIRKRAHTLRPDSAQSADLKNAHYLLAGSGLIIGDVDSSFKDLRSKQTLDENLNGSRRVLDESYSHPNQSESILSSIEQILSIATKEFDNSLNANLNLDWTQHEQDVLDNFELIQSKEQAHRYIGSDTSSASRTKRLKLKLLKSGTGITKINVNEKFTSRELFEKYANIIYEFNCARQSGKDYSLLENYFNMLSIGPELLVKQFKESWKVLEYSKNTTSIEKSSRKYLELQFWTYVEELTKNTKDDSKVEKVKFFINHRLKDTTGNWKFANLVLIDNTPIWAVIFYLLRSGLTQEALDMAVQNKNNFKKVEQSFLTYFKAYAASDDGLLPVEFATRLSTEYNQHIKSSMDGDPFRLAVYNIVGRCYLPKKTIPTVASSIEDWLWLHLRLITDKTLSNESVYERYTLEDFQNLILSHGPDRYSDNYLSILLLSGLFDNAIQYAYSICPINAFHMTVALYWYKFIKNSNSSISPKTNSYNGIEFPISFSNLLGNYVNSFIHSDTRIAAEYIALLSINTDTTQKDICHSALRELILESKDFTALLGKIGRDGSHIQGVIEERKPLLFLNESQTFLSEVIKEAVQIAELDERISDCLLLYQIMEDYNTTISIASTLLADLLYSTSIEQQLISKEDNSETNPILIAQRLIQLYSSNPAILSKISPNKMDECSKLLKISEARGYYITNNWIKCLSVIKEVDLLPFDPIISAREKATEYNCLERNISKNIPNLLILSMRCILQVVVDLKQSHQKTAEQQEMLFSYIGLAKRIMVYAGILQYKMPRETYSMLMKLDVAL
ncbi:hypothetical protein TBLA_0C05250 [Henningerozyma blattae CBS 6284]|uniref:Nuclear pore protein n=1 Tax=Henningerozyma blattae (strain ATCC 34711 / CBS 6284 / DSM 70876 / NBRC 10599 / NRRL Y-10934 / UCD 77-7) TaxID=1071380 RepID=I2H1R9_HENB6|nr:hypothetical protein TBLA_0C05250 [Tetrapisispora blattae CBS 6284]CCH60321.1 hypothetical protein TBLA_0C05250 [Tetrapisispora blattae CBS 6284]